MNDKRKGETNYALVITIVVAFGMMLCMCGGCDPIGVCGWVMAGVGCLQIPMLIILAIAACCVFFGNK